MLNAGSPLVSRRSPVPSLRRLLLPAFRKSFAMDNVMPISDRRSGDNAMPPRTTSLNF